MPAELRVPPPDAFVRYRQSHPRLPGLLARLELRALPRGPGRGQLGEPIEQARELAVRPRGPREPGHEAAQRALVRPGGEPGQLVDERAQILHQVWELVGGVGEPEDEVPDEPDRRRGVGERRPRGHGGTRGDHGNQKSSLSRPTTGVSVSSPTRRQARMTPGMNDVRSVVSWRMVSVCASSPRTTSWLATTPGSRTEWIGTSPFISSAVRLAVPLGASSLPGWWYSTISACCRWREASAANFIMRTAPIAKFGAKKRLAEPTPRSASTSHPVVPTTAWTPASSAARALASAVSGRVKSTSTSASPSTSATSTPSCGSARPPSSRSSAPSTAAHTACPMRPAAPATATRITPRPPWHPRRRAARRPWRTPPRL